MFLFLILLTTSVFALAPPDQSKLKKLKGSYEDYSFQDFLTKNNPKSQSNLSNPSSIDSSKTARKRSYRIYRTTKGPLTPKRNLPPINILDSTKNTLSTVDSSQSSCWPTLYFFHGVGGTHQSYPFLLEIIDSLYQAGEIQAVQVIQINANVGHATASFYTNSSLFGPYLDLVSQYFPQYAQKYHQACVENGQNYLMGHSMGAFGALQVALHSKQAWGGVSIHSGPVDLMAIQTLKSKVIEEHTAAKINRNEFDPTSGKYSFMLYCMAGAFSPNKSALYSVDLPFDLQGEFILETLDQWQKHNPIYLIKNSTNLETLPQKIWIDVGYNDHLGMLKPNQNLHNLLSDLGISHQFEVYPGGHGDQLRERFTLSLLYLLGK